jgi:hypothetical protein
MGIFVIYCHMTKTYKTSNFSRNILRLGQNF